MKDFFYLKLFFLVKKFNFIFSLIFFHKQILIKKTFSVYFGKD